MSDDPAVIEAAMNALPSFWHPDDKLGTARAVLGAVEPLIRAAALEEAMLQQHGYEIAAAIRALKPASPSPSADSA